MRSDMKSKCGRGIIAAIGIIVLLVVGLLWNTALGVLANAAGYVFTPIAFLGDPAPGPEGGTFINDFEPSAINNKGEVLFGADASTGGEGIFLALKDAGWTAMLMACMPAQLDYTSLRRQVSLQDHDAAWTTAARR